MAFDGKTLKRDGSGITPVPQHFNPIADDYEPIYGRNNAGRVELYGPDGNPISADDSNKLAVRATEIESLLNDIKGKDFATQTTVAAILNKIISAPATEAKQTALAALIGEVQASPTANTLLARLKSLEDKIAAIDSVLDAIVDGSAPAVTQLSGSILAEDETTGDPEAVTAVTSPVDGKRYLGVAVMNPAGYDDVSDSVKQMQAQRDIIATTIDNIVDTIGQENILMFLPMWENVGTKIYDLINKDLSFTVIDPAFGQLSPFGQNIFFNGTTSIATEDPIPEAYHITGSTNQSMQSPTAVAAQKVKAIANYVAKARVKLVKVGSPDGSIKLEIRATKDGSAIAGGVSVAVACSEIATTVDMRGFAFNAIPVLQKNTQYYLAVVYDGNSNADSSNYIAVAYDSSGGYGQGRHHYDGAAWTDTAGQDYVFELYSNHLDLPDDFMIISLAEVNHSTLGQRNVFGATTTFAGGLPQLCYRSEGLVRAQFSEAAAAINADYYKVPSEFIAWATSWEKALSTAKLKLYANGKFVASTNGTAEASHAKMVQPFCIGGRKLASGTTDGFFMGQIGPVIMAKLPSTNAAQAIGKVSSDLVVLRKYGVNV